MTDTYYLWLDLETTGLEDGDNVLEIGAAITGPSMQPLTWFHTYVEEPDNFMYMSDRVAQMHAESGLLDDREAGDRLNEWRAWARLLDLIEATVPPDADLVLAGSGVCHFDRRVIARSCPDLDERLTYYTLDVGVLRRALRLVGVDLPHEPTHRALGDVEDALRQWAAFVSLTHDLTHR